MATKKKAKAKSSRRATRSRASAKKKPARRAAKAPSRKSARRTAKAKSTARKSSGKRAKAPARKPAKKKSKARRTAAKKPAARRAAAARPAPKPAVKKRAATPKTSGVLGEGDWKSGQRYNESLQEWGASHDATPLARQAEAELPEDIRESSDSDAADSAARGTEKKSEPEEEW